MYYNYFLYLIEAQISGDRDMGIRILQYILGEAQRTVSQEGPVTLIRLPDARVIYWEVDGGIPDKEAVVIELINYNEIIDERVAREKEQALREREQAAARKLRELGVSDELLAAAGLLEAVR
jgi:hypothetical protein